VGARLVVRVQPGARVEEIVEPGADGVWKLKVREPAREGRANEAVCELLAERLQVSRGRVRVARGMATRNKTIEVNGLTQQELEARLRHREEERG
jgi:uncharacterized protein